MSNNKVFVYVEGFAGNGFEDAGVEIHVTKLFVNKTDAIRYSLNRAREIASEFIDEDGKFDVKSIEEILNGIINVDTGNWELVPESTSFGVVKELS